MKKIDWNKYRETFPDRYLEKSKIDAEISESKWALRLSKLTSDYKTIKILDIGGGKTGTFSYEADFELYLLDPNIDQVPDCYELIDWKDIEGKEFDLIVARDSLNYLKPDELKKIKDHIKSRGIFIGNTFLLPNNINREYKVDGEIKGIEKSTYEKIELVNNYNEDGSIINYYKPEYKGVIHHELIPNDGDKIEHDFYYYDIYQFISFFKPNVVDLRIYGENSVIIKINKKIN